MAERIRFKGIPMVVRQSEHPNGLPIHFAGSEENPRGWRYRKGKAPVRMSRSPERLEELNRQRKRRGLKDVNPWVVKDS